MLQMVSRHGRKPSRSNSKLLEIRRHRVVLVRSAGLASAPYPIVLADAPPSTLLALAPLPMVPADARTSAFLASAPSPIVLADARPSALLAPAPLPIVLADALPSGAARPSVWSGSADQVQFLLPTVHRRLLPIGCLGLRRRGLL